MTAADAPRPRYRDFVPCSGFAAFLSSDDDGDTQRKEAPSRSEPNAWRKFWCRSPPETRDRTALLELPARRLRSRRPAEIRRRLDFIGRSRTYIELERRDAFIADIEKQRRAIREQVAKHDPGDALDLLWQLTELAGSVILRCDNRDDTVLDAFRAACHDLAEIAAESGPNRVKLADRTFQAICANSFGQYADLIIMPAPALEHDGLEHLKARVSEMAQRSVPMPLDNERTVIRHGPAGPVYADDLDRFDHDILILRALEDIADAQGDVDAYIALQGGASRTVPAVAAEIARAPVGCRADQGGLGGG